MAAAAINSKKKGAVCSGGLGDFFGDGLRAGGETDVSGGRTMGGVLRDGESEGGRGRGEGGWKRRGEMMGRCACGRAAATPSFGTGPGRGWRSDGQVVFRPCFRFPGSSTCHLQQAVPNCAGAKQSKRSGRLCAEALPVDVTGKDPGREWEAADATTTAPRRFERVY